MLVSGDQTQIAAIMPELETMTGRVVNLGPNRAPPPPSSCSAT